MTPLPPDIHIELFVFARLRETCGGRSRLSLQVAENATPEACFERLREQFPGLAGQRRGLAVAVNDEYAEWDRSLSDGDEVSFIPPVSGG